jgi:hypothetical protein
LQKKAPNALKLLARAQKRTPRPGRRMIALGPSQVGSPAYMRDSIVSITARAA